MKTLLLGLLILACAISEAIAAEPPTFSNRVVRVFHIDDWDFNWQGLYAFAKPVALPGGTRIDVSAIYDNSTGNARNPSSPPVDVRWGEQTPDEMCIAFLRVTVDAERLNHQPR